MAAPETPTIAMPTFGTVTIYQPDTSPQEVVLFLSGDGGWNLGVVGMAQRLRREGALVVGIDIRAFMKSLESSKGCAYPAGALEELSRAVQLRFKLPRYQRPILVGYSSGATLVYAAIAAAPPETFAGAISLGFCPDVELRTALCAMRGLQATRPRQGQAGVLGYDLAPFKASTVPWMVLQGEVDQVCGPSVTRAFVAETGAARLFSLPRVGHGFGVTANWEPQFVEAYRAIATARRPEEPSPVTTPAVADLSLVEVAATHRAGTTTPWPSCSRATADGPIWTRAWQQDSARAAFRWSVGAALATTGRPEAPPVRPPISKRIIEHYTTAWRRSARPHCRIFVRSRRCAVSRQPSAGIDTRPRDGTDVARSIHNGSRSSST